MSHRLAIRWADPAVVTRQRIAIATLVVLALGACGDRTVTSSPAAPPVDDTPASTARSLATPDVAGSNPAAPAAVADTSLDDVDRILDEVQQDLNTADREASITEGDPTS